MLNVPFYYVEVFFDVTEVLTCFIDSCSRTRMLSSTDQPQSISHGIPHFIHLSNDLFLSFHNGINLLLGNLYLLTWNTSSSFSNLICDCRDISSLLIQNHVQLSI